MAKAKGIQKQIETWNSQAEDAEEFAELVSAYIIDSDEADIADLAEYLAGLLYEESDDEGEYGLAA